MSVSGGSNVKTRLDELEDVQGYDVGQVPMWGGAGFVGTGINSSNNPTFTGTMTVPVIVTASINSPLQDMEISSGGILWFAGVGGVGLNSTKNGFFGSNPVIRGAALSAASVLGVSSGDADTDTVINNLRTRINELESRLTAYGLLP